MMAQIIICFCIAAVWLHNVQCLPSIEKRDDSLLTLFIKEELVRIKELQDEVRRQGEKNKAFETELKEVKLKLSDKCQIGTEKTFVTTSDQLLCNGRVCERSQRINFNPPFSSPPAVLLSFTLLDTDADDNLRVGSSVSDITRTSAKIMFYTWYYSKVYGGRLNWIACPK